MNFCPIIEFLPFVARGLVWVWPVLVNARHLAVYWASEHEMTWFLAIAVALVGFWYWKDNRHGN